jgi:hypothetical protein
MFHLITTYFKAKEPEREAENLECLEENLKNPLISELHLFLQGSEFPYIVDDKLKLIQHGTRPNFSDLFGYANDLKGIKVVANSDIYFNETLIKSKEALNKWDILALTRWDRLKNGELKFYNNFKSQDVWIFSNSIKHGIGEYHIGRHGCDNKLIYEFEKAGYKISNPSYSIRTIHLHLSNLRAYFNDPNYELVSGPYKYILPTYIQREHIKTAVEWISYLQCRYSFYKSKSNNSFRHQSFNYISRISSWFLSKLYAFIVNRKRKKINNSSNRFIE